jgi:hypothetical protein
MSSNLKFELNDTEMNSALQVKECVEYLYGKDSISQIQYLFSAGGGVGPFVVEMLVDLKNSTMIKKDITDYQSW